MKATSVLAIFSIFAASCCKDGTCPPVQPLEAGIFDASTDYGTAEPCVGACQKLLDMGCKEGQPTPAGVTCLDFCRQHTQGPGVYKVHPECIASTVVLSCADVPKCAN